MSMKLSKTLSVAAALGGFLLIAAPAQAEIVYPWCVQLGGGREGVGAITCGFVSRKQCMETARGLGNNCVENPAYPDAVPPAKVRHHHRHKRH
jgi:Protein of unknown function (DUF3551)